MKWPAKPLVMHTERVKLKEIKARRNGRQKESKHKRAKQK